MILWIAIFIISATGGLAAMHSHSDARTQHLEQAVKRLEHHAKPTHVPKVLHRKITQPTLQGVEVANLEESSHA